MKDFNNIFCLETQDLKSYGVPDNTIWNATKRFNDGASNSWRYFEDPKNGNNKFFEYDSIPQATIQKYKIPTKEVLLNRYQLENIKDLVKTEFKDTQYFLSRPDTYNLAHEYARIAAWLRFCAGLKPKDIKDMGFDNMDSLYNLVMDLMQKEEPTFSTWKVSNIQVFKRRLKPFNQLLKNKYSETNALDSLTCKKFGKSNALKLTSEQQSLLIQLHSDPKKPNFEQTYAIYLNRAEEKYIEYKNTNGASGWSDKCLVTLQTVVNFLKRPDVIQQWYYKRHGHNEWRNKFDPIISREAPSFANALWVMDGTPWHRYYMDGKNAYARLNVFPILDAHSWMVIGYSVDYAETSEQVLVALSGAVNRTGVVPYQLQYDHGSANMSAASQKAINALVKYNTVTKVGNARAKIIEPFFKQFNEHVLKFRDGYAGSNITAKKLDSKANREELQRIIKDGKIPTLEEALKDMSQCFKIWNHRPFKKDGKSPLEKWVESMNATADKQREFTEIMKVEAFWDCPGENRSRRTLENGAFKTIKYFEPTLYQFSLNGITVTKDKIPHEFDVENAWFRANNTGGKFAVKHDSTLEKLYLFHPDGKPVQDPEGNFVVAKNKTVVHYALADFNEGDASDLRRLQQLKDKQLEMVKAAGDNSIALTKANGNFTPVTTNSLYPKMFINSEKIEQMESMLGDTSIIADKRKQKSTKKNSTMLVYDVEKEPSIDEVVEVTKEEPKPERKKIDRWSI